MTPTPRDAAIAALEAERQRQINQEGWTPEHDDEHSHGEMLSAAVIYYHHAKGGTPPYMMREDGAPLGWPWDTKWWKPKGTERDLVRAGALCLAEKERLLRISPQNYVGHVDHKLNLIITALKQETRGDAVELAIEIMEHGVSNGACRNTMSPNEAAKLIEAYAAQHTAPDERTLPEGWKISSVTLTVVKEGTKFSDMQFFRVNDLSFDAAVLAAIAKIKEPT